jgi:nitrate reductase assembly molybdenum cofactor insertion protein NarJ
MQNQINLSPVTQFIQQVRSAEQAQSKEVKMSLQQARMLSLALAECMDKLNQDYETMFNTLRRSVDTEIVTVQMDGGGFEVPK